MMESGEVALPEETDESSRQVRIVRKMLEGTVEEGPLGVFRGMLRKSWKMRMNFVFMMQFYRLNNQFEISEELMRRLHCVLCAFISAVLAPHSVLRQRRLFRPQAAGGAAAHLLRHPPPAAPGVAR